MSDAAGDSTEIILDPTTVEYLRKCSINLNPETYQITKAEATIMVLDIRGFTGLCSRIDSDTICQIIREFVLSALEISLCPFCDYVKTLGDGVFFVGEGPFDEVFEGLLPCYTSLIESFKGHPRLSLIDGIGLSVVHGEVFKYEIPAVRGLGYKDYFGTLVNLAFRLHEVIKAVPGGDLAVGSRIAMTESTAAQLKRKPRRYESTSASLKGIPEDMTRSILVMSPADFE
jgi:Adenylate cyclase, family 3 (some proteins contain HAMP domain)